MRSPILEQIIKETENPERIEHFINYYADVLIKIGKIQNEVDRILNFNKKHEMETELEYLKGLNFALKILK